MRIKVQYLGLIRSKIRKRAEELQVREGAPLSELLDKLAKLYGDPLKDLFDIETENILDPTFIVTVNGVLTDRLRGMNTRLRGGDSVALMTLVSGG